MRDKRPSKLTFDYIDFDRTTGSLKGTLTFEEQNCYEFAGIVDSRGNVSFNTVQESLVHYFGKLNESQTEIRGTWCHDPREPRDPDKRWMCKRYSCWPDNLAPVRREFDASHNVELRDDIPDTPAWRKAHKFVKETIRRGKPYTDPDFLPGTSSLFNDGDDLEGNEEDYECLQNAGL